MQPSNARFCSYHDDVNWLKQSSQNKPMKNRMVAGIPGGAGSGSRTCLLPRELLICWTLASCNSPGAWRLLMLWNPQRGMPDSQLNFGKFSLQPSSSVVPHPAWHSNWTLIQGTWRGACGDHSRWKSESSVLSRD